MKKLTTIQPFEEIEESEVRDDLQWLAEKSSNKLHDYGDIIRLLIQKVNELTEEVERMKGEQ